ncbi:winged helix-turn-helix domain-containing protein [Catellatospora sp. KI3]|uniref:ArsR family transcriptional regulator n=1 Tax=Catellatospora sp. KI3 TaxID=3041620 RepID=UPI002482E445|nr:winged helix-turn-helix domain-containing protein [Catellatospora sp. KI3]MDI1461876.1 winged helix-turn-helix domain-containing protein [Catellatospora sp. KI3]
MRALAHPARIAIMEHLAGSVDDVTATECAGVVGLSPSATSYHLRALAKAGLIEDAPSRGDGRERVWRTRMRGYSIELEGSADSEAKAAERAVTDVFLARGDERVRQWVARSADEAPEWYDAALMSETVLMVTAAELKEITENMLAMLAPYKRSVRQNDPPEGARRALLQVRAVPLD